MNIYPSSNAPTVSMAGVANGTTTAVHFNTPSNLGAMQFGFGVKKMTGIQGAVIFDGGTYGSSISVLDSLDTTGRTVHLTQNTLGAFPGDDFFPAGGSLTFTNIKEGSNPGLNLTLGSGTDTVYAQPSADGTISINGFNPATAPGDTINLALGNAQNYLLNGTPSSGSVTSDNLKTLTYTGFETGPNVDDSAPVVVNADFQIAPAAAQPLRASPATAGDQSVSVTFSEDVSAFLNSGFLSLYNNTTASYISTDDITVDYDPANFIATFTFPNLPNAQLPDGTYTAQINAGLADSFGNPSVASDPYTFIWSGGTGGDDNFRVALDPSASIYQVFLNDDTAPAFVAGQSFPRSFSSVATEMTRSRSI